MTAIKPPDGRSPVGPLGPSGPGSPSLEGSERAGGASFRDELGAPAKVGGASAEVASAGGAAADPIAQLAQSVRSGALTPDEAMQHLVDRAVGDVARSLSPAQREQLAGVLRSALESDPTLRELRSVLE